MHEVLLLYLCMPTVNATTIIAMIMAKTIVTTTTVTIIELLDDALSVVVPIIVDKINTGN